MTATQSVDQTRPEVRLVCPFQLRDDDEVRPGLASENIPQRVVVDAGREGSGSNTCTVHGGKDVEDELTRGFVNGIIQSRIWPCFDCTLVGVGSERSGHTLRVAAVTVR